MKNSSDKKLISAVFAVFCLLAQIQFGFGQDSDTETLTQPLFRSAEKNLDEGRYDAAIADYLKILAIDPKDASAYNGRGFAYLEKGELDKAIADFDKNIELKDDDFFAYYLRGQAYFKKGDYQKSIDDHTKELELEPDRNLGSLERGNAYVKLKKFDEAIVDYNSAVGSNLPAAYLVRGLIFEEKGDNAAAAGDLRYYLDKVPDDQAARENLLKLGVKSDEIPAAIFTGDQSVPAPAVKSFSSAIENIGRAEYARATLDLSEAIRIYPKFAAAYFYRGYISELQGSLINYTKIVNDYTKAVTLDPKFVEAYNRRAYVYFFNSQAAKSAADLNRAFALNPKSAQTIYYRGYLSRNEAQSLLDFNQALKLNSNYAEVYLSRADIYENKKQYDNAAADYSAVLKINPNDRRAYEGRAADYCKQGKKELAAADEKRVIDLGGKVDSPCGEN